MNTYRVTDNIGRAVLVDAENDTQAVEKARKIAERYGTVKDLAVYKVEQLNK